MAFVPDVQPLTPEQEAIYALASKPTPPVLERLAVFRTQVVPKQALPYFALRPGLGREGVCPSCGEVWSLPGRCLPCRAAAYLAAEEYRATLKPAALPAAK